MRRLALLTIAATFALCAHASAQVLVPFGGQTYSLPYYVTGEPGNPNRVYVVEAAGRIRVVDGGVTQPGNFLDISGDVCDSGDACGGESGMTSMALAPDYATSGLFYVFYTRDAAAQHNLVIREFRRTTNANDIDETTGRDVLVIPHPDAANHNGGQLQFGPDGLLYISTGDGGGSNDPQNNAQDLTSLLGKLLRIDPADPAGAPTYSVPSSNPFVGVAGADEIYSYGLRNPYRFSFDRLTGDLVIADVGQAAWEEIDFVSNGNGRGVNFGWDCFEGTAAGASSGEPQCQPMQGGYVPPVHQYANPNGGAAPNAAINGGYVIRDTTVSSLLGRYVYADSSGAFPEIRSLFLSTSGASGDASTGMTGGTSSFGQDACGHVYVAHFGGQVSRIQASNAAPACAPQLSLPEARPGYAPDAKGPGLTVGLRRAKRAGARGELTLFVTCDESCTVRGDGTIGMPGKDIGLDANSLQLGVRVRGALDLDLSGKEARRLLAALRRGRKAKAAVELAATDIGGNQSTASRRVKQKL